MNESDKDKDGPLRPQVIDLTAEEVQSEPKAPEAEALAEDPKPADGEAAAEEPAPAAVPPAPRRRSRALWIGVAAIVAGIILGAWLYRDFGQRFWPGDAILALQQQSATLAAADKTLGDQIAGANAAVETLKAETAQLAGLAKEAQSTAKQSQDAVAAAQSHASAAEERLAKLESALGDINSAIAALRQTSPSDTGGPATTPAPSDTAALAAIETRVAALEKELAALKAEESKDESSTAVLSQALSDLKAKLASGAPFADDYARIARMVPAAPGLDVLQPHAETGIANAQGLARELTALAPSLPAPPSEPPPPAEPGYWDWIVAELGSVVTIRTLGAPDWRDVALRAAASAEAGDLPQAVSVIEKTEGDIPAALAAWRNKAKSRLAAEAAIEQVSAAVLRQLAAMGQPQ